MRERSVHITSNDFNDDFLDDAHCIVLHLDSTGKIIRINPFGERLIGKKNETLPGKSPLETIMPEISGTGEHQDVVLKKFVENTDAAEAFDLDVKLHNGTVQKITWNRTIHFDESGHVSKVIFIGIDRKEYAEREKRAKEQFDLLESLMERNIDGEKKAELVLSDREKEFRYLIDHAQVSLTVTDENGVIRNINRVGANMYGREPEDLIGHVFTEFLPEFERKRAFDAFQRDYRAAVSKKGTRMVGMGGIVNKISTPNGLKDMLFYKTGIKVYRDDQLLGILNTAVDITDVVTAREEVKRHQEDLEQLVTERTVELEELQETMMREERLAALGKLAGRVSHEIRNPLGTLSSSLYVISQRLKDKSLNVERTIARADRAIRRCNNIIEEFLDFTRIHPLQKKLTNMDAWLNKIIDESPDLATVPLSRHFDCGAFAEIDPERFRRVIFNVLENAKHAIQEKGDGDIVIESRFTRNRFEIIVKDTGCGISGRNLENVFEPLFSTKTFGVGFGLLICKQIVDQHGGGIGIESREGEGTTVLIWLPVDSS